MADVENGDIIGYLKYERRGFDEFPFNAVDALILSVLAYCRFDNDVPSLEQRGKWVRFDSLTGGETLTALTNELMSREKRSELITGTAASPRFKGMMLNYFVHNTDPLMDKQFSAVTFRLPDRTVFISFRGTDNTLTGWRENFNMAYLNTVPAQKAAVSYYTQAAQLCKSPLPWNKIRGYRIGGHSKGGNLAVYAAVNCSPKLRDQLLDVYSFDGPGFKKNIFESPEYREIGDRVHLLLPQGSIIGTLLTQSRDYKVVSSTARGLDEHDPFSWRISGDDFVYEDDLSPKAKMFNDVLDRWMEKLSDIKRSLLVRTLFEIIDSTDAKNFSDVLNMIQQRDWSALKALKNVPSDERRDLLGIIMSLIRSYIDIYKESSETDKK